METKQARKIKKEVARDNLIFLINEMLLSKERRQQREAEQYRVNFGTQAQNEMTQNKVKDG